MAGEGSTCLDERKFAIARGATASQARADRRSLSLSDAELRLRKTIEWTLAATWSQPLPLPLAAPRSVRLCQSNGRSSHVLRNTPTPQRPLGREGAPLGQRASSPLFVSLARVTRWRS